jgi:hypothetical protein
LIDLVNKLGMETEDPNVCVLVSGKRICGLVKKNNFRKTSKIYQKENLFGVTQYIKNNAMVTSLTRVKDDVVRFVKKESYWTIKKLKINPKDQQRITSFIVQKLMKYSDIKDHIQLFESKNIQFVKKLTKEQIAKEVISKDFRKIFKKLINVQLKKENLKLNLISTKEEASPLWEEILKLPLSMQKLPEKELKQILSQNIDFYE